MSEPKRLLALGTACLILLALTAVGWVHVTTPDYGSKQDGPSAVEAASPGSTIKAKQCESLESGVDVCKVKLNHYGYTQRCTVVRDHGTGSTSLSCD